MGIGKERVAPLFLLRLHPTASRKLQIPSDRTSSRDREITPKGWTRLDEIGECGREETAGRALRPPQHQGNREQPLQLADDAPPVSFLSLRCVCRGRVTISRRRLTWIRDLQPALHRTPSDSQMGTKFFRSAIEDGTTTGTRFRRSGPVEFANQTSESVAEIADFTFVENQKSILQNATLSVLVCFIDSRLISRTEHRGFIQEMYPMKLLRLNSEFLNRYALHFPILDTYSRIQFSILSCSVF
ncbi:hypothetical protein LXL04_015708 [Taraxacum kok-saghyz]